MSETRSSADAGPRADARRNEGRVLASAREAFARLGFAASYHEIARLAGVGVGTVYRRFPDRDALVEAVLLGILSELTDEAIAAASDADTWRAFERFFRALADRMYRHAGLSSLAGMQSGAKVEVAWAVLLDAMAGLCARAAPHLRTDVSWEDIMVLALLWHFI